MTWCSEIRSLIWAKKRSKRKCIQLCHACSHFVWMCLHFHYLSHTHTHTRYGSWWTWCLISPIVLHKVSQLHPAFTDTDNLVLPPVHMHFQHVVSHWSVSSCVTISRIARFSNVQHLSIHISKNFGSESTRVYYIGLRGEFSEVQCEKKLLNLFEFIPLLLRV